MKRLFLLRHAKAVPQGPGEDDLGRVLSGRGVRQAVAIARYLQKTGLRPEQVLSSTAARTRQTADAVLCAFADLPDGKRPQVVYREGLYLAEPGAILAMAQAAPRPLSSLMVVAHNPGLEALVRLLAQSPRAGNEEAFPTGALAVLDFPIADWRDLRPGEGEWVTFVIPKDFGSIKLADG